MNRNKLVVKPWMLGVLMVVIVICLVLYHAMTPKEPIAPAVAQPTVAELAQVQSTPDMSAQLTSVPTVLAHFPATKTPNSQEGVVDSIKIKYSKYDHTNRAFAVFILNGRKVQAMCLDPMLPAPVPGDAYLFNGVVFTPERTGLQRFLDSEFIPQ
jgi:hypothetical protein